MKNINLVFAALSILLFNGCRKDDKTIYTVSGHFYHDCNMEPVINSKVTLFEDANNPYLGTKHYGGELGTTYTDSSGYFKFDYQDKRGIDLIFRISGRDVMTEIPARTFVDNLVVYYSPTINIKVIANVTNQHTINDTLVLNDYRDGTNLSIPGPFSSGLIYNAPNYPLLSMSYKGEIQGLNWVIRPNDTSNRRQQFTINKYCKDTVTVTLTIN